MRAYIAFTKKEFVEFLRTYKLLILFAVFLLFGMMNPLTAKLIPVILDNFMPEGVEVILGEPTAIDSWLQFYKNIPQIGLFIVVILFSGNMAQEYAKGTLINLITKGLNRSTVILSKYTLMIIMWTAAYALCFIVSWAYTEYFWSQEALSSIVFAAMCLWIYGIFLISIIMLGSVLLNKAYSNLMFTGGLVVVQFLLNISPKIAKYNPIMLASSNIQLIQGADKMDYIVPIIISLSLSILLVLISIILFNKKRI